MSGRRREMTLDDCLRSGRSRVDCEALLRGQETYRGHTITVQRAPSGTATVAVDGRVLVSGVYGDNAQAAGMVHGYIDDLVAARSREGWRQRSALYG